MGKAGKWWSTHFIVSIYLAGLVTLLATGDLKADGNTLMAFLQGITPISAAQTLALSTIDLSFNSLTAMATGGGDTRTADKDINKGSDESKEAYRSAQEPARNKLVFFQGSLLSFDLEDLLCASAEVLQKGSLGTAYNKAVLEDGTMVVVKRLKDAVVSREEF